MCSYKKATKGSSAPHIVAMISLQTSLPVVAGRVANKKRKPTTTLAGKGPRSPLMPRAHAWHGRAPVPVMPVSLGRRKAYGLGQLQGRLFVQVSPFRPLFGRFVTQVRVEFVVVATAFDHETDGKKTVAGALCAADPRRLFDPANVTERTAV